MIGREELYDLETEAEDRSSDSVHNIEKQESNSFDCSPKHTYFIECVKSFVYT